MTKRKVHIRRHYRRFRLTKHDVAKFWANIDRRDANDCWPWLKGKSDKGYGVFYLTGNRGSVRAHRAAFVIQHGHHPSDEAMHTCDHRACCNGRHLVDGTHDDNMKDMVTKGRQATGSRVTSNRTMTWTKVSKADVVTIRQRRARGESPRLIASTLGISEAQVVRIATGRDWRSAPGPITPPMSAREAQLLGAAAKKRKTFSVTIPYVVSAIRKLLRNGKVPKYDSCKRKIRGFNTATCYFPFHELVRRATVPQ